MGCKSVEMHSRVSIDVRAKGFAKRISRNRFLLTYEAGDQYIGSGNAAVGWDECCGVGDGVTT